MPHCTVKGFKANECESKAILSGTSQHCDFTEWFDWSQEVVFLVFGYAVRGTPAWSLYLELNGVYAMAWSSSCDKYYHFYSICFGLGCGTALYRPFCRLMIPSVLAVICTIVFEVVGIISDLPAHTRRCKGPPYDRRDVYWGFCFALFVAILNLNSYHVYTLSYGCGIMVFALRGAKRKHSSLRNLGKRQRHWW